jgi:hypothetical protein
MSSPAARVTAVGVPYTPPRVNLWVPMRSVTTRLDSRRRASLGLIPRDSGMPDVRREPLANVVGYDR